jgi:hypothetical protein
MPPSEATSQYPHRLGVAVSPRTGWLRRWPPMEPKNRAVPKLKMPPSAASVQ